MIGRGMLLFILNSAAEPSCEELFQVRAKDIRGANLMEVRIYFVHLSDTEGARRMIQNRTCEPADKRLPGCVSSRLKENRIGGPGAGSTEVHDLKTVETKGNSDPSWASKRLHAETRFGLRHSKALQMQVDNEMPIEIDKSAEEQRSNNQICW